MPIVRAVVTLPSMTSLPRDASQNTFYFGEVNDSTDRSAVMTKLAEFYNENKLGTSVCVGDFLSPTVRRTAVTASIELYELPATPGPVGAPVATSFFTLPPADQGSSPLPQEVAVCLSFHGNLAGVPESVPGGAPGPVGDVHSRARRRGRIYLGPLGSNAMTSAVDQTTPPTVNVSMRNIVTAAAADLIDDMVASGTPWVVFSRTAWTAQDVVGGWVDNEFDTQRRRQQPASSRTTFS